jgi:hypothetical protein
MLNKENQTDERDFDAVHPDQQKDKTSGSRPVADEDERTRKSNNDKEQSRSPQGGQPAKNDQTENANSQRRRGSWGGYQGY